MRAQAARAPEEGPTWEDEVLKRLRAGRHWVDQKHFGILQPALA